MILRNLLYFIAVILIIGWVLGYLVWKHEGHTVHIMLVIGIISLVFALMQKPARDVD